MRESERKVGRADNNPAGAQTEAQGGEDPLTDAPNESVDEKTHGAHGRGRGEEKVDDNPPTLPDKSAGSDRGGSGGWGSAASGGSVFDKRHERDD